MNSHRLPSAAIIALSHIICVSCGQSGAPTSEAVSGQNAPTDSSTPMATGAPPADGTEPPAPPASSPAPPSLATPSAMAPEATAQPTEVATQPPALPAQASSSAGIEGEPTASSASVPGAPEVSPDAEPESSAGTEPEDDASGGAPDAGGGDAEPTSAPGEAEPSAGCSMDPPADCTPCQANGLDYYIDLPEDYDPMRPYPVVFQYHPLGGSGQQARTMYRVQPTFPDAIYVSPDGSDNGFPNSNGVDEEVTRTIMDTIEATLCVDTNRYFATGFSYGGSMSYTAACNMSDKFRAVAAMAGAPISGAACTSQEPTRPVAVLGIHGEEDTALAITMAEPIVESWLEKNGCTGNTEPSDLLDSICEKSASALEAGAYQGCMDGYPVVWCPMPGRGHEIPSWSGEAISRFFQQF